jgi:hypothetical protein
MREIDKVAKGDAKKFAQLYDEQVKKVVEKTPAMLRKTWWILGGSP